MTSIYHVYHEILDKWVLAKYIISCHKSTTLSIGPNQVAQNKKGNPNLNCLLIIDCVSGWWWMQFWYKADIATLTKKLGWHLSSFRNQTVFTLSVDTHCSCLICRYPKTFFTVSPPLECLLWPFILLGLSCALKFNNVFYVMFSGHFGST